MTAEHEGRRPRLVVLSPAFNEEAAIADVVREVREAVPGAEVVVVDDGSVDRTADVAEAAGARVVRLPFNIGVGGALRAGLLHGLREGADAVVQCDADGQHPARYIPELVRRLDDADIVIGARFSGDGEYPVRGPRRWAMLALAWIMTRLHGVPLTDVTSGFRAFGPRAQQVLSRELPPEYLADTIDALIIAKARGLRVVQVSVAMRPRTTGVPSHQPIRAALYLARATLVLLLSLTRLLRVPPEGR